MGLVDETYRYLYDTAAYYGTGVEYLIGGIVVAVLLFLWIIVRLTRGRKDREREIVVKLMKEEEPSRAIGVWEARAAPGGITISPGEVVIKAEGRTTRIPRDRVSVDLRGGKLEIKVLGPLLATEAAPEKKVEAVEAAAVEKRVERSAPSEEVSIEEPAPPEAPSEEPRTLGSAMKGIAKRYSLSSITLITPEGLLVDSISKAPEKDAEVASELLSEVKLGDEIASTAVEGEDESKYLIAYPHGDTHAIFLIRSKEKVPSESFSTIQEELKEALKLLST